MKAIYLTKYGESNQAFELRETDQPQHKSNQVVIKVKAFGLNFADVIARRGLYQDAPPLPALLGYDVAGTVVDIGSEVKNHQIGDKVFAMSRFGGYAEYVATAATGVAKLPAGMAMTSATALATQAGTAFFCACQSVQLHKGDKVLIQAAAGGVGTALVQIAKSKGCYVIGTASSSKQDYLKSIGVDLAIDYVKDDFLAVIESQIGKNKLDYVFDSIGGKVFKKGLKALIPGGTMVFFGAASQVAGSKTSKLKAALVALKFGVYSPIQFILKSQGMIGVNMLRIADYKPHLLAHCLTEVTKMAEAGILKPTIGKVFQADQIAEAHDYLESRKSVGKVVMEW